MSDQMDAKEFKIRIDAACNKLRAKIGRHPDLPSPYDTDAGGREHNLLANEYARDNARISRKYNQDSRLYYEMIEDVRGLQNPNAVEQYICKGIREEIREIPSGSKGINWSQVNRQVQNLPAIIRDYSEKRIDALRLVWSAFWVVGGD